MTTTNRPTYTLTHDNGWYTLNLSTGRTYMADGNDFEFKHEVEAWADHLADMETW